MVCGCGVDHLDNKPLCQVPSAHSLHSNEWRNITQAVIKRRKTLLNKYRNVLKALICVLSISLHLYLTVLVSHLLCISFFVLSGWTRSSWPIWSPWSYCESELYSSQWHFIFLHFEVHKVIYIYIYIYKQVECRKLSLSVTLVILYPLMSVFWFESIFCQFLKANYAGFVSFCS